MLRLSALLLSFLFSFPLFAQIQKRPLTAAEYDRWQSVKSEKISDDGHWITYQIDPQDGDGRSGSRQRRPKGVNPPIWRGGHHGAVYARQPVSDHAPESAGSRYAQS